MQNTRFTVLTGHLNDYPLGDLIGILRHQQKTGRLLIEYPKGPASFFFNEGELVDAQLGDLSGLQAICVAVGQPPANFNFNPLVRPTNRSIEKSLQRVISELLGCWDETVLQLDAAVKEKDVIKEKDFIEANAFTLAPKPVAIDGSEVTPLALPGVIESDAASHRSWSMLGGVAAGLMVVGLSTAIAVTGEFGSKTTAPPLLSPLIANGSVASAAPETGEKVARTESKKGGVGERAIQGEPVQRRSTSENSREREVRMANDSIVPVPDEPKTTDGKGSPPVQQKEDNVSPAQSIRVVMQIENGRVLKASIASPRSGMEGYEAMALRIARQRRYPVTKAGQESVTIKVQQGQ